MPYGHQIWSEEPLAGVEHKFNAGIKGHIRIVRDQPEVKLFGNTLLLPNAVRRTPDQS